MACIVTSVTLLRTSHAVFPRTDLISLSLRLERAGACGGPSLFDIMLWAIGTRIPCFALAHVLLLVLPTAPLGPANFQRK